MTFHSTLIEKFLNATAEEWLRTGNGKIYFMDRYGKLMLCFEPLYLVCRKYVMNHSTHSEKFFKEKKKATAEAREKWDLQTRNFDSSETSKTNRNERTFNSE